MGQNSDTPADAKGSAPGNMVMGQNSDTLGTKKKLVNGWLRLQKW